jgi:uncharacterized protein (DUF1330 family)
MAAYLIAEYVEILDTAAMDEYRRQIMPTLEPYEGRVIVRGGKTVPLEGGWEPMRLVIIEFPSLDHAQQWYASDAYRGPMELRKGASRIRLIFVEGM